MSKIRIDITIPEKDYHDNIFLMRVLEYLGVFKYPYRVIKEREQ